MPDRRNQLASVEPEFSACHSLRSSRRLFPVVSQPWRLFRSRSVERCPSGCSPAHVCRHRAGPRPLGFVEPFGSPVTATKILAEIISSDVALLVTFNQAIAYLRCTAAVGNQASENLSPDVPLVFRKCTRARRLCTAARSCLKAFWCLGGPICRVSSLWRMEGNYSFANQSGRPEIFVKAIQFSSQRIATSKLPRCRSPPARRRVGRPQLPRLQ